MGLQRGNGGSATDATGGTQRVPETGLSATTGESGAPAGGNAEEEPAPQSGSGTVAAAGSHGPGGSHQRPCGGSARSEQGVDGPVIRESPTPQQKAWIAWQVPSPIVLAAAPPGQRRLILKDALQRNLEANGLRMLAAGVQALMRLPQDDIVAALAAGPRGSGAGAAALRSGLLLAGRPRHRLGHLGRL